MKKLCCFCACVLLGVMILTIFVSCSFSETVNISNYSQCNITFIYSDKNISEPMCEKDSNDILNIFNGRECYKDNPSCGFDENISLSFGKDKFLIACDGWPIIKYKGKFFNVSESEIEKLHKIMEKYSANFPCI